MIISPSGIEMLVGKPDNFREVWLTPLTVLLHSCKICTHLIVRPGLGELPVCLVELAPLVDDLHLLADGDLVLGRGLHLDVGRRLHVGVPDQLVSHGQVLLLLLLGLQPRELGERHEGLPL